MVPQGLNMPGTRCAHVKVRIVGSRMGADVAMAIHEEEPT